MACTYKMSNFFDDYTIDFQSNNSSLGNGLNGVVYRTFHNITGDQVAVKFLEKTSRSCEEIRIHLLCLPHENIVEILQVYEDQLLANNQIPGKAAGVFFAVVMEAMDKDLFTMVPLSEQDARNILFQIANALNHIHLLGIMHCDIKLENILVRQNNEFLQSKLCDFGFATTSATTKSTQCTPLYAGPEIVNCIDTAFLHMPSHAYNSKCDVWALGVTTYIALCGYPPFYSTLDPRNKTGIPNDMRRHIKEGRFSFYPENKWAIISGSTKQTICKMLKVAADDRPSASALLHNESFFLNVISTAK